jgi:HAD superfamily hydrolase (TIGR01490 family)
MDNATYVELPTAACSNTKAVVAVFDFDKTLTIKHSFWRFLRTLHGPVRFWWALVPLSPPLIRFAAGRLPLLQMRERMMSYFLDGFPAGRWHEEARRYATSTIPAWIDPTAFARLRWHQDQGHRTILISNAPEDYLRPWADLVGINDVSGSIFEIRDGTLTGSLVGTHCFGEEKVVRLKTLLGNLDDYEIYAYGDSSGDNELLAAADHPFYRTFS